MIYNYTYNSYWQLTENGLYCNTANSNTYHAEYIPVNLSAYDYYADTRITIDKTNCVYVGWYTYDEDKANYPSSNYYEYVVSNYTTPCTNKRFIKQMFNISHPEVKFIRTRLINNYQSRGEEGCSVTIHSLKLIAIPKGQQFLNISKTGIVTALEYLEGQSNASFGKSQLIEGNCLYEY